MAKVHILPEEVISKIAAGEVIERPASVVKELLENSLDAAADSIELRIRQAGRTLIHLRDTGSGIESEDIENIFLRHSTSKISSVDDIFKIASLGFRGEALYSIASISDITLRSKTRKQDSGWEIHLRAGKKEKLRPINMPTGTEIEVKELFFNTPARRKFLKSDSTELNHTLNTFIPYTLLYPEKRFTFINNDKPVFELTPDKNTLSRIARVLHLDENHLIEAKREFPEERISIHLVLGDVNIQRVNKEFQFIFVNSRPVTSRLLSFHLNQIYRLIFPADIHPFFAIYINLPLENIDVNVHPAKREIKIKDEYSLISMIRPLCENTLMSLGKAKQINLSGLAGRKIDLLPITVGTAQCAVPTVRTDESLSLLFQRKSAENKNSLKEKLKNSRYIGVFLKKYILFETSDSLLLVDQHAASERINFEKLKNQIEANRIEIQQLLTPILIRLSHQEKNIWEESKEKIEKIGLSTTLWDNQSVAIHAHPAVIANPEISLRALLSTEETVKADIESIARRACRQSVMSGDEIKKEHADSLRAQLSKCGDPFTCPHGRPALIEIKENDLNKQFLRG